MALAHSKPARECGVAITRSKQDPCGGHILRGVRLFRELGAARFDAVPLPVTEARLMRMSHWWRV